MDEESKKASKVSKRQMKEDLKAYLNSGRAEFYEEEVTIAEENLEAALKEKALAEADEMETRAKFDQKVIKTNAKRLKGLNQVVALIKKNGRIHSRTAACPCFNNCCGPGKCVPFVVCSACCCHAFCPIFFILMVTAVPYLSATAGSAATGKGASDLDVLNVPPVVHKPYSLFSKGQATLSNASRLLYGTWGRDYGDNSRHYNTVFANTERDRPHDKTGTYNWKDSTPIGVRTIVDGLYHDPSSKSHGPGSDWAPNQYSCYCKTLGIVGPSDTAKKFKEYLQTEYDRWETERFNPIGGYYGISSMGAQVDLSKKQFFALKPAFNLHYNEDVMNTIDYSWRRLSEATRTRTEEVLEFEPEFDALEQTKKELLHKLGDPLRPLRALFEDDKSPMSEDSELSGDDSGRRLAGPSTSTTTTQEVIYVAPPKWHPDRIINLDAYAWNQCNTNDEGSSKPFFRIFGSEKDVQEMYMDSKYGDYFADRQPGSSRLDRLCGVVVLNNDVLTSSEPDYTIRMNVTGHGYMDMPYTSRIQDSLTDKFGQLTPDTKDRWNDQFFWYYNSGFFALQHLMHNFLATKRNDATGPTTLVTGEPHFVPFPVGASFKWVYGDSVKSILQVPFSMTIQFGPIVASLAYHVARERLTRQRELMRMMGLSDAALLWSWILLFTLMNFFITLACAALFKIFVLKVSNWFMFWILFFFYANGIAVFGMSVAAFISSDKWAALVSLGIFFGASWTYMVGKSNSVVVRVLLGLIPSNGFLFSVDVFLQWEWWRIGADWSNMFNKVGGWSYFNGTMLLFFDFWLWIGIYYYFDQIVPWHSVGISRWPWFPCTKPYWREFCGHPPIVGDAVQMEMGNPHTKPEYIEPEDQLHLQSLRDNNQTVTIEGLAKQYKNTVGAIVNAVDGLSVTMYQDECFCLLGHNGAGKTTTMMMVTGCLTQSAGTIRIRGYRIPEQVRIVRASMGFCPQHNVLWDELTVTEHLELFGSLGGMTKQYREKRGDLLLGAVALLDKKQCRAAGLSGGMKRKLSCALAFLAEPYMVILDEPSSGMDPFARRGMWDTLKRWRSGHIICLTTHYMDEADALGDRIAIMSHGKLACKGSASFLKQTFGCGYVISFAKTEACEASCYDRPILDFVKSYVGNVAEMLSAVGREVLVQVPFTAAEYFPELFPAIDDIQEDLGIESYGTSVTNLEEVFIKVAKEARKAKTMRPEMKLEDKDAEAEDIDNMQVLPRAPFSIQLYALLLRRWKFGIRDKISFLCNLFLPVFCLFVAVLLLSVTMVTDLPSLELNVEMWNEDIDGPKVPLTLGWGGTHPLAAEIKERWSRREGLGPFHTSSITPIPYLLNSDELGGPFSAGKEGTILEGMEAESGFVKELMANRDKSGASQFGAVFYPDGAASWCPSNGSTAGVEAGSDGTGIQMPWGVNKDGKNDGFAQYPGVDWWPTGLDGSGLFGPTIFQNLSAHHAAAVLFNAHGEVAVGQATNGGVKKIVVKNHPLDKTEVERSRLILVSGIMTALMMMAAYGFLPATATFYVVHEREKDIYNQLVISGVNQFAYWLSNLLFDVFWGMIPITLAMMVFWGFNTQTFITEPGLSASLAMLLMFLPSMAGFAYLVSFMFAKAGNALIFSWLLNLVVGLLGVMLVLASSMSKQTMLQASVMKWIFSFHPTYCLGYGFMLIGSTQKKAKESGAGPTSGLVVGGAKCKPRAEVLYVEYFETIHCVRMIGDELMMMGLCAVVTLTLVISVDVIFGLPAFKKLLQAKIYPKAVDRSLEDDMVVQERIRVKNLNAKKQYIYVQDLHKVYPNRMHAVKGISFACSQGQIFGLLGINGAGKTTTFKILCGQEMWTEGKVMIQGMDVSMRVGEVRRYIGYCPQFDALLESLTVEEHLYLYGRIKGLKAAELKEAVRWCLSDLDLKAYIKSRAGGLSGGNKRKLSCAMATIGEPPMIFLDEPSAGMDPVARRGMWTLIQNIAEKRLKSVVILTTHSMEEAEALCSRLAIQVEGQFRCLGTPQQIKSKYGEGLELNVRLATPAVEAIEETCKKLGGSNVVSTGALVTYSEASRICIDCFGAQVMTALKNRHGTPLFQAPADPSEKCITLGALAEWGMMEERVTRFEGFLLGLLNVESKGKPCALVMEKTQNVVRYQILHDALQGRFKCLGSLFGIMRENKDTYNIDDYQVSQTSLEQIFNQFAALQLAATLRGKNRTNAGEDDPNKKEEEVATLVKKPLEGEELEEGEEGEEDADIEEGEEDDEESEEEDVTAPGYKPKQLTKKERAKKERRRQRKEAAAANEVTPVTIVGKKQECEI